MSDDDFDEEPRRKKKRKPILSGKQATVLLALLLIFVAGAAFQHYYIEPIIGEGLSEKLSDCLTQTNVLDERFVSCRNDSQACEFQLEQCLQGPPVGG